MIGVYLIIYKTSYFSLHTVEVLPFGGVGNSGTGSYHGKHTFDAFSHHRGVLKRKQNMEFINKYAV